MLVWRLYVNNECVGTYGDGPAAMSLAIRSMQDWLSAGYSADRCDVRQEQF